MKKILNYMVPVLFFTIPILIGRNIDTSASVGKPVLYDVYIFDDGNKFKVHEAVDFNDFDYGFKITTSDRKEIHLSGNVIVEER